MTDIGINARMDSLQVAATRLIEDLGDLAVRGHLTEHPDLVAQRLDLLVGLAEEVRGAVERERAADEWKPLNVDPAAEHLSQAAEFAAHSCSCPYCWHAAPDHDADAPLVSPISISEERAAALGWTTAAS